MSHCGFHPCANQRRIRAHQRHSLTLHVRAHQCAVRVIVLKERNERGGDRHELLGRNVTGRHFRRRHETEVPATTHGHQIPRQRTIGTLLGIGLGDDQLFFFHGGKIFPAILKNAVFHQTIRRFDKAVLVHLGVGRQGVDQTDVRAFRRFNRADTAIMGRMNVTDFKACTFTRQTARTKR